MTEIYGKQHRAARRRLVPTDFYWLPAAMALLALALRFGPDIRQTAQKR